jgi:hypothetical protein
MDELRSTLGVPASTARLGRLATCLAEPKARWSAARIQNARAAAAIRRGHLTWADSAGRSVTPGGNLSRPAARCHSGRWPTREHLPNEPYLGSSQGSIELNQLHPRPRLELSSLIYPPNISGAPMCRQRFNVQMRRRAGQVPTRNRKGRAYGHPRHIASAGAAGTWSSGATLADPPRPNLAVAVATATPILSQRDLTSRRRPLHTRLHPPSRRRRGARARRAD